MDWENQEKGLRQLERIDGSRETLSSILFSHRQL